MHELLEPDEEPECLSELHGKPSLEWQLASLREAGIADIAIITDSERGILTNYRLTESHNPRWEETNMVSSLSYAEDWLCNTPCIIGHSDIFYTPQALAFLS